MRTVLLVLGMCGVACLADGQTTTAGLPLANMSLRADSLIRAADGVQARGHVEIAADGVTITADEADLTKSAAGTDMDLRGSVHVAVTAPPIVPPAK